MTHSLIILTGFSGTGKTEVARDVAKTLGWGFFDTDEEVVAQAGKPIADIFADEGELRFRELELQAVLTACQQSKVVIATGGGSIVADQARAEMLRSGFVVCLEATPETIYQRIISTGIGGVDRGEVRPLLAVNDPLEQIRQLKRERQWAYAMAHWTVQSDAISRRQVAHEIVRAWRLVGAGLVPQDSQDVATVVHTASGSYPVYVGWDILDSQLGPRMCDVGLNQTAYIVSDEQVFRHHGRAAQHSLEQAGIEHHVFVFPGGERNKTPATAEILYRWLAERRAERGHVIVAFGGGVVGDLAGFVAATYLRGMPFIQVPTSLTAMVDASIGGKVAVDLPIGKNLVGAFHQPALVLADVKTLTTMPRRELAEGWAEAVKHGLILDRDLFEIFEAYASDMSALEPKLSTDVIRRSAVIKADVVGEDEKEEIGRRTLLNYGHTIGHGLEAASGYTRYLHGEAVAIGMMGAAQLGHRMGVTPLAVVRRQETVLKALGLPTRFDGIQTDAVLDAMSLDKKVAFGKTRWVFLEEVGCASIRQDVPSELVRQVVESLQCE